MNSKEDAVEIDSANATPATSPQTFRRTPPTWSTKDVFDWNLHYAKQFRGILNIVQVIFSLVTFSLLASSCQIMPYVGAPSSEFVCKAPDTFLFVISCSSFISSTLILICCLMSHKTDDLLHGTTYEVGHYIVYFVLYMIASLALIINLIRRNTTKGESEEYYRTTMFASVFGLIICFAYGVSTVWFFVCHKFLNRV